MSLIFDTHAHYDDQAFDEDREEILSGLFEKGVGFVVDASAAARSLPRILQMTRQYDFLYAMAGLHPCETYGCGDNSGRAVMCLPEEENWLCAGTASASEEEKRLRAGTASASEEEKRLRAESAFVSEDDRKGSKPLKPAMMSGAAAADEKIMAAVRQYDPAEIISADWTAGQREMNLLEAVMQDSKVLAVGEIGLDYHYEDTRKDIQKNWFAAQIAMAKQHKLPINVHSRDAAADTLDLVKAENARDVGGIIHCFSYGKEMAAAFLDLGFCLGVGGVVTFKNAKKVKEVVSYMPLDRLVLETDCPYLAPTPFRGERNDSSMIKYAAQVIADIKGISAEQVITLTEENARRVYQIKAESSSLSSVKKLILPSENTLALELPTGNGLALDF